MNNGHGHEEGGHSPGMPSGQEVARRFNLLLERFPRADGEPWRAVEIERETGGEVTSSYVSALRKGKFKRPGMRQLSFIANVMGFPFELFMRPPEEWDEIPGGRPPGPLSEVLELDARERAVVLTMRRLEDRRKDAVMRMVQQLEIL